MPKRIVSINKTNQARIDKWIKTCNLTNADEKFEKEFNSVILDEVKNHKELTEKSIVTAILDAAEEYIAANEVSEWKPEMMDVVIYKARHTLVAKYTAHHSFNNNIDIYFNDVKREYILHPMNESDSLEFLPENRDIFIKNNLKLVVNCAKRYRGLGLPFEDLIQTGNYGLLVAFEKFDKNRANLRGTMVKNIEESGLESFTFSEAFEIVSKSFTYDKDLDRTLKLIPEDGFSSIDEFKAWVQKNVKTAVFASIAFQWIQAYILLELSKQSSTVKIPKPPKQKLSNEEAEMGYIEPSSGPAVFSLDSMNPRTNDNYHDNQVASVAFEQFTEEDNQAESRENEELFKRVITKAIATLSDINRRIIRKRFGIGYPCALNVADIAESEGLASNRVKYIISSCLQELGRNISDNDKELLAEVFGKAIK